MCLCNLRISLCIKQCHAAFRLHELKSNGELKDSCDPKLHRRSWTWAWPWKCALCSRWSWLFSIYMSSRTGLHMIKIARASLALSPPMLGPVRDPKPAVRVLRAVVWVTMGWLICWVRSTPPSLTSWQSDDQPDWLRFGLRKWEEQCPRESSELSSWSQRNECTLNDPMEPATKLKRY